MEDSHGFGFYLQGVSPEICKIRNYILYTGKYSIVKELTDDFCMITLRIRKMPSQIFIMGIFLFLFCKLCLGIVKYLKIYIFLI